jgi:hypothetical protein
VLWQFPDLQIVKSDRSIRYRQTETPFLVVVIIDQSYPQRVD